MACETPHHAFPDGYGSACACGRFQGALVGVCIGAELDYDERVRAREAEGLTRSDAQGVVDAEILGGE